MLAGLAISFIVTPRYVSQAEMRLIPALGSKAQPDLAEMLQQYQQELLSRTSLSRIIQDPRLDLYKNERAHVPFEDVIERMRSEDIRIRVDAPRVHPEKLAFNISFAYEDPLKAQQTVQALITGFEDANLNTQEALQPRDHVPDQVDRMEARIAALEKKLGMTPPPAETGDRFGVARTGVNLDVLDPPSLPVKPIAPNRAAFMFAGFGGGFACAVLIAVFRRPAPPLPFPAQTA
jgi:LPS O-antigen subunit length determinant protein (WzzB/FepE family)